MSVRFAFCGVVLMLVVTRDTRLDAACAVNSPPDGGGPWCCHPVGGEWEDDWPVGSGNTVRYIPLYVHQSIIDDADCYVAPCGDGNPSALTIRNTMYNELNQIRDITRANIAVVPWGDDSTPLDEPIYGAIKIQKRDVPGELIGKAAGFDNYGDNDKLDACVVSLENGYRPEQHIFMHEVGHCLGMQHPFVCGDPRMSIMDYFTTVAIRRYEIGFLEKTYPARADTPYGAVSTNYGATWTSAAPHTSFAPNRGSSACNAGRGDAKRFAITKPDETVWWWQDGGTASQLTGALSPYRPAVACSSYNSEWIGWLDDDNSGDPEVAHTLYLREWVTGNYLGEQTAYGSSGDFLSGTYDPVTGKYLLALRDSTGNLFIYTSTGLWSQGPIDRIPTGATIACGPSSLGVDNCVIAYSKGWGPTLHWVSGHVDPVSDVFVQNTASRLYNGYRVVSTPAIVYSRSATYPWVVTFHQGGNILYSLSKGASVTDNFTYRGFYQFTNQASPWAGPSPAVGSWCAPTSRGTCVFSADYLRMSSTAVDF